MCVTVYDSGRTLRDALDVMADVDFGPIDVRGARGTRSPRRIRLYTSKYISLGQNPPVEQTFRSNS